MRCFYNAQKAAILMCPLYISLPWATRVKTRVKTLNRPCLRWKASSFGRYVSTPSVLTASVKCHCLPGRHTQRAPLWLKSPLSQEPMTTGNESEMRYTSSSSLPHRLERITPQGQVCHQQPANMMKLNDKTQDEKLPHYAWIIACIHQHEGVEKELRSECNNHSFLSWGL